ncbi:MAG TPA: NlpC/P60 family protein [Salinimicrobium sp.]|nr:NlpC/P60 family protein [Salinimicrobium sp.]
MQYGICHLSLVPLRSEPSEISEMRNQLLYGEHFTVLEQKANWFKIKLFPDNSEGWIDQKQFREIREEDLQKYDPKMPFFSADLIEFISDEKDILMPIPLGSVLNFIPYFNHKFEGNRQSGKNPKSDLVQTAFLFLNAPFLWGGKSPFGIDSSGLCQMVYRLNGYDIERHSTQQAALGEALSFIEESEPGDLAFFDDQEGNINHVGIMMSDNYIIHAYGKVRIDRIDHSGIFNTELGKHTHQLRVIKKII